LLVVREVPVGAGEMRKSSLVGSHVGEFGVCVPPVGCLNPSVDPTLLSGVAGQKADAGRPPSFLLVVEISYGAQKSWLPASWPLGNGRGGTKPARV